MARINVGALFGNLEFNLERSARVPSFWDSGPGLLNQAYDIPPQPCWRKSFSGPVVWAPRLFTEPEYGALSCRYSE